MSPHITQSFRFHSRLHFQPFASSFLLFSKHTATSQLWVTHIRKEHQNTSSLQLIPHVNREKVTRLLKENGGNWTPTEDKLGLERSIKFPLFESTKVRELT